MATQASDRGCDELLTRRQQRFHSGGVGLVLGSTLASSDTVRRLALRSRLLKTGLVVCLLVLCTAGGFASAKVWDGRDTSQLALGFARDAALDEDLDFDMRRLGLSKVADYAEDALETLRDLEEDGELGEHASIFTTKLRSYLPTKGTPAAAIGAAANRSLGPEERLAALKKIRALAFRSLTALRIAAEDPVLALDARNIIEEIQAIHLAEVSSPALDAATAREPK